MTTYQKIKLKGFDNKLPKYKPIVYPQPKEESNLPKNYLTSENESTLINSDSK